jgi:stalled ribosome rescue protein Dom34
MSLFHAVVLIDHQQAQVLQFDAEHVQASRIKTHQHYTKQHGSQVRSEHEFFSHVCDALEGVSEVLVTGSKTALADFRHYIEKHRVPTSQRVVGFETVDQPTQHQLVALARQYFLRYDRMAGTPTPT